MTSRVAAFIARGWCVPETALEVDIALMHGGLESAVSRARVTNRSGTAAVPDQLVVKELRPGCEREADMYELLWSGRHPPPAVRLLGREEAGGATYLYLEAAQPISCWPWADTSLAAAVARTLARLHDRSDLPRAPTSTAYEPVLAESARATLELAGAARDEAGRRHWRRLGDLRRLVSGLPEIRSRLLSGATTLIHGDVHPGNVILRGAGPEPDVVLIDWARARTGSPLEDIASWLHSLGCWEPQARRRHDSLMRAYLQERHHPPAFGTDLRRDYWLASASNGLSGAIRYHLAVLSDRASSETARYHSARALPEWERVALRAASLIRTSPGRCT